MSCFLKLYSKLSPIFCTFRKSSQFILPVLFLFFCLVFLLSRRVSVAYWNKIIFYFVKRKNSSNPIILWILFFSNRTRIWPLWETSFLRLRLSLDFFCFVVAASSVLHDAVIFHLAKNCYFRNWKKGTNLQWVMYFFASDETKLNSHFDQLWSYVKTLVKVVFLLVISPSWVQFPFKPGSITGYSSSSVLTNGGSQSLTFVTDSLIIVWIHYVMVLCKQSINLTSKFCLVIRRKH